MRVLLLHESPEADTLAREFVDAAEAFNRGLDIRLRFLDVGFELRRLPVSGEDREAQELEALLGRFQPTVLLVIGHGPRLLECVSAAAKTGTRLAYVLNGEGGRTAQAIARVAHILMRPEDCPPPAARPDVRTHLLEYGTPSGAAVVEALVRSGRGDQR